MQDSEIIQAIHDVLAYELNIANIDAFSATARLNEDLYLDSVLVLQLLIGLELKLDFNVPDDALDAKDFATVATLTDFLKGKIQGDAPLAESTQQNQETEEFEDIKVHCFVSCLCECIKAHDLVDHRPFYFGVWDADVVVDSQYQINYHAEGLNHDFFRLWFQKLYGVEVKPWYKAHSSKSDNIATLTSLLDNKTASQNIMVMLDMFRLPERENKFNQNPFPHYVMLENTQDPSKLFMWDPDFRWEGEQDKQQVLHAIESDAVAGGYLFDSQHIKPSEKASISEYFIACFKPDSNPMTDAVRKIIHAHTKPATGLNASALTQALTQLPVLAIRKYAYEHGLAFFMLELGLDFAEFEDWCDVIEELVSSYKHIQFRAMKIASNVTEGMSIENAENKVLLSEIEEILNQQDKREFSIKQRLTSLYQQWLQHNGLTKKQTMAETSL
ncbi:phosphopantetheine-binding protein [Saccharobesus litoralis]|uniref:Phosphopantetheine-binding protein n=1 Tax=Saccharobesus litoralis TaxID=2172099 RepID=A0A2S0VPH9_9ALTE|nr:DUF6005 family protein [Saccharobesus litoralis]AWB66127.1 phosphopantetheine-binding protein [Saccharobesus litoralis]